MFAQLEVISLSHCIISSGNINLIGDYLKSKV
jgi:Ran GTPase-activating protein (RanGAP) involved in mRNA processing and transport